MSEFEKQNNEAFGLVKDGQQLPRCVCHFVPDAEYRHLKQLERDALEAEELAEQNAWKARVWRIAAAIGRAACGTVFIGGALEGLMDPAFAGIMAGICVVWSLAGYFWGRSRG